MRENDEDDDDIPFNDKKGINDLEINDLSLSQLNNSRISFDDSGLNKAIINSIEDFFKCPICSKIIIENAKVCEKCLKLFCSSCIKSLQKCKICNSSTTKMKEDKEIKDIIQRIFSNGKIIKENINFSIFLGATIKDLYKENQLKCIIKEEEIDLNSISSKLSQSMIEGLSDAATSPVFNSVDDSYSYTNIFDIIEISGNLMKKQIEETRKNNPNKFIDINESLTKDPNSNLFISGILAKFLTEDGIDVAIERQPSKSIKESIMNWLITGLYKCKVINIYFDFTEKINNEILTNKKLRDDFIKSWISKISSDLKIKQDNIYFKSLLSGHGNLSLIITENFNEDNLNKINNKNGIKDIQCKLLLEGCIISPDMFDTRYNNDDSGWAKKGEKRGGREYDPPYGWYGYGLNVINKYDKGKNIWLGMRNIKGEWWVAYHGAARGKNNDEVKNLIKLSYENELFEENIFHKSYININEMSNIEYPKVGIGLHLYDKISIAESFSGIVEHLNNRFKIVFMCRVCPNKVRISKDNDNYFVVDPNDTCVRPYRILIKVEENNHSNDKCIIL